MEPISQKELAAALRALGHYFKKAELRALVKSFDENGDGVIDINEFRSLVASLDDDEACNGAFKCPDGHPMQVRQTSPPGYGGHCATVQLMLRLGGVRQSFSSLPEMSV